MFELVSSLVAREATHRFTRSALPDAPVVAPERRRLPWRPVRRGTAAALRRLADRLAPA
jgi:hypothetical protein